MKTRFMYRENGKLKTATLVGEELSVASLKKIAKDIVLGVEQASDMLITEVSVEKIYVYDEYGKLIDVLAMDSENKRRAGGKE